jgi:hypothetical protein
MLLLQLRMLNWKMCWAITKHHSYHVERYHILLLLLHPPPTQSLYLLAIPFSSALVSIYPQSHSHRSLPLASERMKIDGPPLTAAYLWNLFLLSSTTVSGMTTYLPLLPETRHLPGQIHKTHSLLRPSLQKLVSWFPCCQHILSPPSRCRKRIDVRNVSTVGPDDSS